MQGGASRERRAFLLGHVRAAFAGAGAHGAGNVGKCVWNLAPNLAARRAAREHPLITHVRFRTNRG